MRLKIEIDDKSSEKSISSLLRAIEIVGSQKKLSKIIGIGQQSISKWLIILKRVPAERVLDIEKATHGKVTRYDLRPDLYKK